MQASREEIQRSMTLTQYILTEQSRSPGATGKFSTLLHAIEIASKYTAAKVKAAGLSGLFGLEGSTNTTGDSVKKLDVLANEAFITALTRSQQVCVMVSEENEGMIQVGDASGKYAVAFDPLDGSSNIDANVSIGTIFSIFKRKSKERGCEMDLRQPGVNMVAAGYTMYGSATVMVLTMGSDVNGFTLDPATGEFLLSHPHIQMPASRSIYSVNEGNSKYWYDHVLRYVHDLKHPEAEDARPYSQRYVGSMVADVHRTLLYGGIFMYPGDKRAPKGKLRLLYEGAPMAMLIEAAGGAAVTESGQRILELVPEHIHDACGVLMGSMGEVDKFLTYVPSEE